MVKGWHFESMRHSLARRGIKTGRKSRKISPKARMFISREIRRQRREGKRQKQAIAIAHTKARKKGFKVPRLQRKKS